jgi:Ni,Fe-hydrogenase I large subunit
VATVNLDPVGRIEGHLGVELTTAADLVTGAKCQAQLYRGFENIAYQRPVQDCIQIMQRI